MNVWRWFIVVLIIGTVSVMAAPIELSPGIYAAYRRAEDLGDGFGAGAKIGIKLTPSYRAEGHVSYIVEFDGHHQDVSLLPLELALSRNVPLLPLFETRLGAGAGYYLVDGGFTWPGSELSPRAEDDFGYFLLAAAEAPLRDWRVFAEIRYTWLTSAKAHADGESLRSLKLDGLGGQAGLLLRW